VLPQGFIEHPVMRQAIQDSAWDVIGEMIHQLSKEVAHCTVFEIDSLKGNVNNENFLCRLSDFE
jgi:hypothetical protein